MTRFLLVLGCLLFAACGNDEAKDLPAGAGCSASTECRTPLSCQGLAMFDADSGMCTEVARACTQSCVDDVGCASLGPTFKCFAGCAGAKFCGNTR